MVGYELVRIWKETVKDKSMYYSGQDVLKKTTKTFGQNLEQGTFRTEIYSVIAVLTR